MGQKRGPAGNAEKLMSTGRTKERSQGELLETKGTTVVTREKEKGTALRSERRNARTREKEEKNFRDNLASRNKCRSASRKEIQRHFSLSKVREREVLRLQQKQKD